MAKPVILLLSTLCFLALSNFVVSKEQIVLITGRVFCDPCRLGLVTPLAEPIKGAKVNLICLDKKTKKETLSVEGETNEVGSYNMRIEGDHENDVCEVSLVSSPRADCKETFPQIVAQTPMCVDIPNGPLGICNINPLLYRTEKLANKCVVFHDLSPDDFKTIAKLQKYM